MRAGGLMLLPRGGVSALLKPPNNLPQLVLIGNLPGNCSRDLHMVAGTEQASTDHDCSKGCPWTHWLPSKVSQS